MSPDLHFERLPALFPLYLRALFAGRSARGTEAASIPAMRAYVERVAIDSGRLADFRQVLAHPDDGLLPPTFPQVLATPLHMKLLTRPGLPIRASGLVHMQNSITLLAGMPDTVPLKLVATLAGRSSDDGGIELDLGTTASADGEVVWRSSGLVLARRGRTRRQRRASTPSDGRAVEIARWEAPADTGRRYARVSGDYNPIHLCALTARPFGFRSAIAHGMWSLGRVIAGLHRFLQPPVTIDVRFRRPLLLPTEVRLLWSEGDPGHFALEDVVTGKTYLSGSLAALFKT